MPAASFPSPIAPRRFTVDEYYRMGQSGILGEDERVELIEGEIIEMTPIGSPHASHVTRLSRKLTLHAGESALVAVQNPVRLSDFSEPEPDIALLRPRDDFYRDAHPGPADVFLIIEVSDTSLAYDRDTKVPLYARHGVPAVWLVDLQSRTVHVFSQPTDDDYADAQSYQGDDVLQVHELGLDLTPHDIFI